MQTVKLFRPVGPAEYELIRASGFLRFPPRLPGQPIFYPVTNEAYAIQIARDWNAESDDGVGFVLRFEVSRDYLARFEKKIVGSRVHEEYWIPAEQLEEFNDQIIRGIETIHTFHKPTKNP